MAVPLFEDREVARTFVLFRPERRPRPLPVVNTRAINPHWFGRWRFITARDGEDRFKRLKVER